MQYLSFIILMCQVLDFKFGNCVYRIEDFVWLLMLVITHQGWSQKTHSDRSNLSDI